MNTLSRIEIDRLWIPFVVFSNTENQESTKGDDESEVTITREGDFTENSIYVKEEINIFEGIENKITFQQVYSKSFKCVYQLQLYPFDTQLCTVEMEIRELERSTVDLEPENVFMESETLLVQYIISHWSLSLRNSSTFTSNKMDSLFSFIQVIPAKELS